MALEVGSTASLPCDALAGRPRVGGISRAKKRRIRDWNVAAKRVLQDSQLDEGDVIGGEKTRGPCDDWKRNREIRNRTVNEKLTRTPAGIDQYLGY